MSNQAEAARTRHAIDQLFYTVATELTGATHGASTPAPAMAQTVAEPRPSKSIGTSTSTVNTTLRVDRGHVFRVTDTGQPIFTQTATVVSPAPSSVSPVRPQPPTPIHRTELEITLEQFRTQLIDLGEQISDQLSQNNSIFRSFENACRLFQQLKTQLKALPAPTEMDRPNTILIESGR
ncbi:MAG TPA: hypothetical protein PKD54_09420 [Pirellulaceae bacterium]|nr:hypothetical protein [Pirellulaceae bacterium]